MSHNKIQEAQRVNPPPVIQSLHQAPHFKSSSTCRLEEQNLHETRGAKWEEVVVRSTCHIGNMLFWICLVFFEFRFLLQKKSCTQLQSFCDVIASKSHGCACLSWQVSQEPHQRETTKNGPLKGLPPESGCFSRRQREGKRTCSKCTSLLGFCRPPNEMWLEATDSEHNR